MAFTDYFKAFPAIRQLVTDLQDTVTTLKSSNVQGQVGTGVEHVVAAITKADFMATHLTTLVADFQTLEKGVEALASHLIEQDKTIAILTAKLDQVIALMPGQPAPETIVKEPDPAVMEKRARALAAQMIRQQFAGLLDMGKAA